MTLLPRLRDEFIGNTDREYPDQSLRGFSSPLPGGVWDPIGAGGRVEGGVPSVAQHLPPDRH